MKGALRSAHESTCEQLRNLNCPIPDYMNSNAVPKSTPDLLLPKPKLAAKKKSKKTIKVESDVDEEYLKFYQEGLKYREDYGKYFRLINKVI